ncbi:MAG: polysaccharide biosynthesis/export family protein [Paracoccaceae bacterium]
MRILSALFLAAFLSSCGVSYQSSDVKPGVSDEAKVRVVQITPQTALVANRSAYRPQTIPAIFSQTAGGGSGLRGAGAIPEAAFEAETRPAALEMRVPPAVKTGAYRIGISDVLLLATPQAGSTVEELSGLLAAQNRRQGYTVQDDGAIAIPDVGRIPLAGLTLEEAEAELFQKLVENQIDPSFSLEIAEFNSKKVSIGGAVATPAVAPITLRPLYLDEALTAAGGVTVADQDYASVRIYRNGALYQIPLNELYSKTSLRRIQLIEGDSVFVDTAYELEQAARYFEEQIRIAEYRQSARSAALSALNSEVALRRNALNEARANFKTKLDLGGIKRDYVYLAGEIKTQSRYALPFEQKATLADALYDTAGGIPVETGNVREIYVLRGSTDPREFAAITAWQLDARNAAKLLLATRFELRPNDVIFVAEQPVTRWARVIRQITPALITTGVGLAAR